MNILPHVTTQSSFGALEKEKKKYRMQKHFIRPLNANRNKVFCMLLNMHFGYMHQKYHHYKGPNGNVL